MRTLGLAVLAATVAGCGMVTAENGPVRVTLGPAEEIRRQCADLTGQRHALGCFTRTMTLTDRQSVHILCPFNSPTCLAHEVRHLVEPGWIH